MNDTPDIARLREYLLDRLPEAESEEVELALMHDDRSYELLLAVEEELIDDYIRNALPSREASYFLAYLERLADGRPRVRFARALSASSLAGEAGARVPPSSKTGSPSVVPGWYRYALPAAVAALLLLAVASVTMVTQLSRRVGELEAELGARGPASRRTAVDDSPVAGSRSPEPTPHGERRRASVLLSAGVLRGSAATQQVAVSDADELVELRLDLPADSDERYRAVLRDEDGNEVVSSSQLRARVSADQVVVVFLVPAATVTPGDYYVELEGSGASGAREAIGRFDFRAIAESSSR